MLYILFGLFLILCVLAHVYLFRRLFSSLRCWFPKLPVVPCVILFALLVLPTPLAFLVEEGLPSWIGKWGNYWIACLICLLVTMLLLDGVSLLIRYFRKTERRRNGPMPLLAVLPAAALVIGGRWNALQIRETRYDIVIDKTAAADSLTLILLSDLHLGFINDADFLERVVARVNAQQPDLVCIAGDLFDNNFHAVKEPARIAAALNCIKSRYGVFLCWGNHDAGNTFSEMRQLIASTQVHLLEDDLYVEEGVFAVAGRRDSAPIGEQQGEHRVAVALSEAASLPLIVLDHRPSHLYTYDSADLILCGHTHQGQIFPGGAVTSLIYPTDYGYYQEAGLHPQMVVTSGVGTWGPPIRIGTRSELAVLKLTFS